MLRKNRPSFVMVLSDGAMSRRGRASPPPAASGVACACRSRLVGPTGEDVNRPAVAGYKRRDIEGIGERMFAEALGGRTDPLPAHIGRGRY